MRTIIITLILVGIMEGLSGTGLDSGITNISTDREIAVKTLITAKPSFAELGGSMFLAVKTDRSLDLNEGAIVEFVFKRKSLKSFHVNDINQEVINKGEADVLVMVHEDLALTLKAEKLSEIKITNGTAVYSFTVEEFWQPHSFIKSL